MTTEAFTRKTLIDQQLAQAGWSSKLRNVTEELQLRAENLDHASSEAGNQFIDYALLGPDQRPIAIVEAKRTLRDSLAGKRQASDYADGVKKQYGIEPFIFLANGESIWFWDRRRYPPRLVAGFFTLDDLQRLAFQGQYREALTGIGSNPLIAGRPYQIEAIKRITEGLERSQRKFLLVMATGTGKTRTVVALIELLMRTKWVQRILFLADRRELVRQALGDFKEHMPGETRARIEGADTDWSARIHVATYPSMMQVYQQLSPGYYDLIIADESHRSIYNRYKALFDYFDAIQLGLTATPTDYIDHNTFELFSCPDGLPTFYYPFETAVEEGYLVNYRVLQAQTTFQLQGIRAGQLPHDFQRQLEEQGIELAEIDFEGSDIERRVSNTGTNDAIVQEFMLKCRKDPSGTLPAKTILFAISHRHAVELWQSFNRLFPDLQRRGLAEVIDSHMERADQMLDDFKHKDMPRVAISVDMLDTGIDVPALQNLVFAKPVFSQVKFWQMIGRGTRLWSDPHTGTPKNNFLIMDYWNNFAFFNMNPEGEVANPTEPLPVRLFRTRLEKLILLRGQGQDEFARQALAQLQEMLSCIPRDNANVRSHLAELDQLADSSTWDDLDAVSVEYLSRTIAPLLRYLPDVTLQVMTFVTRTEHLAVAHLTGQLEQVDKLQAQVVQDLSLLPTSLRDVQAQAGKLAWMISPAFWQQLDYQRIMDLQTTFGPLMIYRQRERQDIIHLNLPDQIATRRWVIYGPDGEGAFADSYREQLEVHIRQLAEHFPAIIKLKRGEQLSDAEVTALAAALNRPDLFVTEDVLREVYQVPDARLVDFVRHILGLSRLPRREDQIKQAFDEFISSHSSFTAMQINFVRTLRSAALRGNKVTTQDLQRPPYTRIGSADHLFTQQQLTEILDFTNNLVG